MFKLLKALGDAISPPKAKKRKRYGWGTVSKTQRKIATNPSHRRRAEKAYIRKQRKARKRA